MNDTSLKSWALRYAEHGYAVFPLSPRSKIPLEGSHGFYEATTDKDTICNWWDTQPDYNIGIRTGSASRGLIVIDVDADPAKNKIGKQSLIEWEKTHGVLPATCTAISGTGGIHYYFISRDWYKTTGDIGGQKHIDLRAEGGYIVAPPSVHPDTRKPYTWKEGLSLFDVPPTMLSGSAKALASFSPYEDKKTEATARSAYNLPDRITAGTRTQEMIRLIGKLRSIDMADGEIRHTVQEVNQSRCDPPLTAKELEREVFTALKRNWQIERLYEVDSKGIPRRPYDHEIYRYICENENLFVIGSVPYVYDHGVFIADANGTKLKTKIMNILLPQFIRSDIINRIYKLFLMDSALQETAETVNAYPSEWVPFKNGFYDAVNEKLIPFDPKYKAINQLAYSFEPDKYPIGEEIDKWLEYVAPDPHDREMLLEYCGYCMTKDTRQQKFLMLCGTGGSGKSTVLQALTTVIGADNVSAISLKGLTQRFASYGVVGKLLNCCADIEVSALEDVATIKKATGEDPMPVEPKGVDSFTYKCYAKFIFSTNELPLVLNEKTDAFYRRLMVLNMNGTPPAKRMDYFDLLKPELDHFIYLSMKALHRMYINGKLDESSNSINAVSQLRQESDTVEAWLIENCYRDSSGKVDRGFLYENYQAYCMNADRTALKKQQFFKSLRLKKFGELKSNGRWFFEGIAVHGYGAK